MTEASISLKVMSLNAENLFLLSDRELTLDHLKLDETQWQKLSTSIYENKPLRKAKALGQIIFDESPDIIAFCEVGGLESLKNFNELFLGGLYSPALIEGNSDRNIDVGFLVRKTFAYYFDIVSNRNRPINYLYPHERPNLSEHEQSATAQPATPTKTSHKFSRDVAELHLFRKDREKPFLIFLATHLKSRLDPDGIDPNGFERRQAEVSTLIDIYKELEAKFQNQVPIVIAGDFNGNASPRSTDPEFKVLYESTHLRDVGEIAGLSEDRLHTYYQIGRNSRREGKQLDYCFLSPTAQKYLDKNTVHFYRYRDHLGLELDPPTTMDAKSLLPSDHYPILFSLNTLPVI